MGCRSDYQDPTPREQYCQLTAQLYRFVLQKLELPIPTFVNQTADSQYASRDFTNLLCNAVGAMGEVELSAIVYNGRDPVSRKLADWWEQHRAVDAKHAAQDAAKAYRAAVITKVKAYLTPKEFAALNIKEDDHV